MCSLTTQHGIKWNLTTLNGHVAYQRDHLTVLWLDHHQSYVILNAECKVVFKGPLQECLDSVRYDVN